MARSSTSQFSVPVALKAMLLLAFHANALNGINRQALMKQTVVEEPIDDFTAALMADSEMDESVVMMQGEVKVARGSSIEESGDAMYYAFDDSDMLDASELQAPWAELL